MSTLAPASQSGHAKPAGNATILRTAYSAATGNVMLTRRRQYAMQRDAMPNKFLDFLRPSGISEHGRTASQQIRLQKKISASESLKPQSNDWKGRQAATVQTAPQQCRPQRAISLSHKQKICASSTASTHPPSRRAPKKTVETRPGVA